MRKLVPSALVLALALAMAPAGLAQTSSGASSSAGPTSSYDRLFLSFIEDATLADRQWWEVQFGISDGDNVDTTAIRGVVAFQPWDGIELGGRMGFGNTDTSSGLPDGSGGTDLEVWGKYKLGSYERTEFVLGSVLTVPTGDDTAGLGFDAFALSGFAAMRHRLERVVLTGQAGIQLNDDGAFLGFDDLDGEISPVVAVGVIVPFSDQVTVTGEARFAGERFDGADNDTRIVGGVNWRSFGRGMLRGSVTIGLDDGAPDAAVLVGYATQF
jgi:hypothetical protein